MNLPSLTNREQKILLKLSRGTLDRYLQTKEIASYETDDPTLLQEAAVFVTLHLNGRLRGCVGQIKAEKPLYMAVQSATIAAGFSDPRFPPLKKAELETLQIKIAFLSPLLPIAPDEIVIGEHGLLLEAEGRRGLLLPEVAAQRGWDTTVFLEQLCHKANLPPGSWRNAKLFGFTTIVFEEPLPPI
jgi:AmmeMemoRadiSam system protein A